ncbi:hypothetical protein ACI2LF_27995 [Kribbella sp. NPDC020789]
MRTRVRDTTTRILVRVWFGDHLLSSYVAEPALAARFAAAMQRRLTGVRVTTDDQTLHHHRLTPS